MMLVIVSTDRNIALSMTIELLFKIVDHLQGCGCGSVGRVVASGPRDPQFESSHWQIFV